MSKRPVNIFIAASQEEAALANTLGDEFARLGYDARRLEDAWSLHYAVDEYVSATIRRSDVVVGLMAGHNPNVFFELGLAAGANIPIVVAATGPAAVPIYASSAPYVALVGDAEHDAARIARVVRSTLLSSPKKAEFTRPKTLADAVEHPDTLDAIHPSELEELVGEFFESRGSEVERGSADDGFDFRVDGRLLVEIKAYRRENKVSVDAVRRLHSSVLIFGAERGILVASSGFTASATALATQTSIDLLTLKDLAASDWRP